MKYHPLTSKDVSQYLGITESYGYKALDKARIKPINVSGTHYYQYSQLADLELERWEKGHKATCGEFTPNPVLPTDSLQKRLLACCVEVTAAFPSGGEGQLCAAIITQAIKDLFNDNYQQEALRYLSGDMPEARLFLGEDGDGWVRRMIREYYLLGDI